MEYTESSRNKQILQYDANMWQERETKPINTLQLFITNKCNLRCRGCFYADKLGNTEMSFEEYKKNVLQYRDQVQKVILLGGEPTIHSELEKMLKFNQDLNLKTTIYTNGFDLKKVENLNLEGISIRVGVYGSTESEKPLSKVDNTKIPVDVVYMLRRDNVAQLFETAQMAEDNFNCKSFYVSSIREVDKTLSFWKDTAETLPIEEYVTIVQDFVNRYQGNIPKLHIAKRGVLFTENKSSKTERCRFGNIFPDGKKVICPFDISRNITSPELTFDKRDCNKHTECILQKIVLEKKEVKPK